MEEEGVRMCGAGTLFDEVVATISRWSGNDDKVLSTGVRLICPTPSVAPEAWLHVLFPPATGEDITTVEEALDVSLPTDFREFLVTANGLRLFSNNISVWGIRQDMSRNGDAAWPPFDLRSHNRKSDRPEGSPSNIVYFGSTGRGQSWSFFDLRDGSYVVGITDRHKYRPEKYWPNFASWLIEQVGTLKVGFNADGTMIPEDTI